MSDQTTSVDVTGESSVTVQTSNGSFELDVSEIDTLDGRFHRLARAEPRTQPE